MPQEEDLNSAGISSSNVKDTTVVLAEGAPRDITSSGDGLEACSEQEIGLQPGPEPDCPDASKIGTVEIDTPLLPPGQHLTGSVYLAAQNQNPFGSLIALYLIAEDPISGSLIKVAGNVQLSSSGQIVSTFSDTPQLAFEDLKLHFFGGSRAPLATPALCGPYTTNASITPWSEAKPASASSSFQITSGPNKGPCPNPRRFRSRRT